MGRGGNWTFGASACTEHEEWARAGRWLFASPEWAAVVESLGGQAAYAWNSEQNFGVCVAVFRRMWRQVGVFGMPVAGSYLDGVPSDVVEGWVREVASGLGLTILRVSRSLTEMLREATSARPELWIESLPAWEAARSSRLRRDLAFAHRASGAVSISEEAPDPSDAYRLYAQAVAAHGGVERYGPDYFHALAVLAVSDGRVQILSARAEGRLVGFAVLAVHGEVGYYLHAAVAAESKGLGLGDLLLERLVGCARTQGCMRLDLMASPWEQPGLTRFKGKWADAKRLAVTQDVTRGIAGDCARALLRWRAREDRSAATQWLAQ